LRSASQASSSAWRRATQPLTVSIGRSVAIRFVRDSGREKCWTSTFPAEAIRTNTGGSFDGR